MIFRILVFYILTFFFTILLGGLQMEVGLLPGWPLPQFAPGIAGLLMLVLYRKDKVKMTFEIKSGQWKRYLGAVLIPFAIMAVVFAVLYWRTDTNILKSVGFAYGPLVLLSMFAGALGEEIGWRGYLARYLNKKWRLFWATLLTGVLWALWHVQLYANGTLFMVGALLAIVSYSFMLAFLLRGTKYNIFIATLFHFSINVSNRIFSMKILTSTNYMLTVGIVWAVVTVILVLNQKKLFRKKNV